MNDYTVRWAPDEISFFMNGKLLHSDGQGGAPPSPSRRATRSSSSGPRRCPKTVPFLGDSAFNVESMSYSPEY
jgi:hypothetical protein